ncbi:MAG: DUF58 domain-containing protein, partial [Pseudomonadota bacterium]
DAGVPLAVASSENPGESTRSVPGVNDFEQLRSYVPGDRLSRVHWPASSRTDHLQVKQFVDHLSGEDWLDWSDYAMLEPEARLQHLSWLVQQREATALPYGLKLPGVEIPPEAGAAHCLRCLNALAVYGEQEPNFG